MSRLSARHQGHSVIDSEDRLDVVEENDGVGLTRDASWGAKLDVSSIAAQRKSHRADQLRGF